MAIKPRPYKLSCARCGWSKTFAPQSDAITARDYPHACPKCNAPHLKCRQPLTPWQLHWLALARALAFKSKPLGGLSKFSAHRCDLVNA